MVGPLTPAPLPMSTRLRGGDVEVEQLLGLVRRYGPAPVEAASLAPEPGRGVGPAGVDVEAVLIFGRQCGLSPCLHGPNPPFAG